METETSSNQYELLINDSNVTKHISFDKSSWINKPISCLPMAMGSAPKHTTKNKQFALFIAIISTLANMYHFAEAIWWVYDVGREKDLIAFIIYLVEEICILFSRSLSIYYCYHYCDYPWIKLIEFGDSSTNIDVTNNIQRKLNVYIHRIKYVFYVTVIIVSVEFAAYSIDDSVKTYNFAFITANITAVIFVFLPQYLILAMAFSIFLKYYAYLACLKENITKCSYSDLLNAYTLSKKGFDRDYNDQNNKFGISSLKWSVMLFLLHLTLQTWTVLYAIAAFNSHNDKIWLFIADLCIFPIDVLWIWLFVNTGSAMSEEYQELEKLLYENGEKIINCNDIVNAQYCQYNHLLQYIEKYPLMIKLGSITLTNKTAIQSLFVFGVARFAAYSAQYLYD